MIYQHRLHSEGLLIPGVAVTGDPSETAGLPPGESASDRTRFRTFTWSQVIARGSRGVSPVVQGVSRHSQSPQFRRALRWTRASRQNPEAPAYSPIPADEKNLFAGKKKGTADSLGGVVVRFCRSGIRWANPCRSASQSLCRGAKGAGGPSGTADQLAKLHQRGVKDPRSFRGEAFLQGTHEFPVNFFGPPPPHRKKPPPDTPNVGIQHRIGPAAGDG